MKIRTCLAACAALATFGAANATDYVESAVETTTSVMHLPTTIPQTVTVRACAQCKPKDLAATADTRYFVGKTEVTLDVLRKSSEQTNTWIYVFYDARQKVITRIKLEGVLDPSYAPAATPSNKRQGN